MLKCCVALAGLALLKAFTAGYIFLLWLIDDNGSTFAERQQLMVPELSATNSTATFVEKVKLFRMPMAWMEPEEDYFDVSLSDVRPSSRLLDCDYRLMFGEPSCITLLYCFVTTVLFAFNYFVSQSISDARHLIGGTYAGIVASAGAAGLIARAVQFDHVVQPGWWYAYPVLAHFAALTASFWSVVMLRADLVACLHQLKRDARCEDFALLPPSDTSALVYPCVCTLSALVVAHLIKATFAHHELHCAGLCWLADSSLYISLHAPVLVFALINLVLFYQTASDFQSSYHGTDMTVQTVYDALCDHFIRFAFLVGLWYMGLGLSLLGYKTLWHLTITLAVTSRFGSSLEDPLREELRSIFVTPFTFDLNNLANPYLFP